jgi:hypothetical protein
VRRALSFLAMIAVAAAAQPDAREIVRRSVAAYEANWELARNYTFLEREQLRQLDAAGRVKSADTKTYDLTLLDGTAYRRLVERDDQPLPPREAKREQEKLDRSIAEQRKQTPAQRSRRIAEVEKRRARNLETAREVAEAFDFRIAGEEHLEGRDAWVIEATPHPGYQPRHSNMRALAHLRGKIWIDKQQYGLVKVEAEVIDVISWGVFLVRVERGSRLLFEQNWVNDEVWLPRRQTVNASARLGLLKGYRAQQEVTYKDYRKFQADSRLVPLP